MTLSDLRLTGYDLVGYLLPGGLFLAGLCSLYWLVAGPSEPVHVPGTGLLTALLVVVAAYFCGHLAQAVANLLGLDAARHLNDARSQILPEWLVATARAQAVHLLGPAVEELKPDQLFDICDAFVAQKARLADRELYVAREAFYRGGSVSSLLLGALLVVKAALSPSQLIVDRATVVVPGSALAFAGAALLIAALLFHRRYLRFMGYRLRGVLLAFLVVTQAPADAGAGGESLDNM